MGEGFDFFNILIAQNISLTELMSFFILLEKVTIVRKTASHLPQVG